MAAPLQQFLVGSNLICPVMLGEIVQHDGAFFRQVPRARQCHINHRLRRMDVTASITEGLEILCDRNTVECNRTFDTLCLEREKTGLIRHPQEKDVGGHMIAEQALSDAAGVDVQILFLPGILINCVP